MRQEVTDILTIDNTDLSRLIGDAEAHGIWLIYGAEKNGKTMMALALAKALHAHKRVAYISAEEGTDYSFKKTARRSGLTGEENLVVYDYMPLSELIRSFKKRYSPPVIILDNLIIYADELKVSQGIKHLEKELPHKLIIALGHEERGMPYPASAKMAAKMAKVIFHVRGLTASVVSRFATGGVYEITPKAEELWGGSMDSPSAGSTSSPSATGGSMDSATVIIENE